jgi:hypothetical protein
MNEWTKWRAFPDPHAGGYLFAPFGAGVYQLGLKTGQFVMFGVGKKVASRMSALLPKPLGFGTRNNAQKRAYVRQFLPDIEYRTTACSTRDEAEMVEKALRLTKHKYIFKT